MKKIIFILIILNNFVFGNINNKFISAFEKCDITGIKTALKNGANINTVAYTMDYVNSSALTFALRNNRREIAKFLIENGIDVNIVETVRGNEDDYYNKSALIIATENNDVEMMELLLANGAKVSYQKDCDSSPIVVAAKKNAVEALLLLIKKGADVNEFITGITPLIGAAYYDAKEAAEILIQNNANIDAKTSYGDTPLLSALQSSSEKIALFLIENNADIRAKNNEDFTTLHYAVQNNLKNIAFFLIEKGLDVNAKSKDGLTPLHLATEELVPLLVEKGANINEKANYGNTKLHYVAGDNQLNALKYLLENNVEIDSFSKDMETPLMNALENGNWKVARILIENGANCNLKNKKKLSPILLITEVAQITHYEDPQYNDDLKDYVKKNNSNYFDDLRDVVKLLINNTSNENKYYYEDGTKIPLLLYAISNQNSKLTNILIEENIDIFEKASNGATALIYASAFGFEDTVELLIEKGAIVNDVIMKGDFKGETALKSAIRSDNKNVVKILIANGAKKTDNDNSLLSIASNNDMKKFLINLGFK